MPTASPPGRHAVYFNISSGAADKILSRILEAEAAGGLTKKSGGCNTWQAAIESKEARDPVGFCGQCGGLLAELPGRQCDLDLSS